MYRIVTGKVLSPSGNPRKGSVKFEFTGSFDNTAQYPTFTETIKLNFDGTFSVPLWVNELGESESSYNCVLPGGDSFSFTLPIGSAAVDLGVLRERSVTPFTPNLLDIHNNDPNAHLNIRNGDSVGNILTAATITGGRVIAMNADGRGIYADSLIASTANSVIGISTNSAATGTVVNYKTFGRIVEPTWNWTVNSPLFVGTDGQILQSPLVSGYILKLGVALSPVEILLNIGKPILR